MHPNNQISANQRDNTTDIENLKQRFFKLLSQLKSNDVASKQTMRYNVLWTHVMTHYTEPHRHYHTLAHIDSMLSLLDIYSDNLVDKYTIELAIWYHDIIYDPARRDNEYQSAHYMHGALKDLLQPMILNSADALIIATKTHTLPDVMNSNVVDSNDTAYFLDMDLAVLGKPWEDYERYTKQVRLEYCHVTADAFKQGRKAVLETFLERDRLYFTDDFYQRYEQQARANLIKEIELNNTV